MQIGRRNQLAIAIEDTAGTAEEPTHFIPFLECSLIERHTPIADTQTKAIRDLEGSDSVEGKKWGEGDIKVVLDPTTSPYWFALALGAISSEISGDDYEHTITRASNDPLTATIWRDRVVDTAQFTYSVVNSLKLNFADDVASLSANILSKFPTEQARTIATTSLSYYTFRNATVTLGETETKVKELTLTIENNAEPVFAPGDNDVDRIAWKGFRVSGNFSLLFEDETEKDAFTNLTKKSMTITFTGDDGDSITINIPSFRVDNRELDSPNDDLVAENISFVAEYDSSEEKTIDIVVVNGVETYESTS